MSEINDALNKASTFAELKPLLDKAKVEVSFWGNRYVKIEGCKGTVSVEALVSRVHDVLHQNFEFDENERKAGNQIAGKIDQIYSDSDNQLKHKNLLTKVFFNVIHLVDNGRFKWRGPGDLGGENDAFKYYTMGQYINAFGSPPPKSIWHGFWSQSGCPDRWQAPSDRSGTKEDRETPFTESKKGPFKDQRRETPSDSSGTKEEDWKKPFSEPTEPRSFKDPEKIKIEKAKGRLIANNGRYYKEYANLNLGNCSFVELYKAQRYASRKIHPDRFPKEKFPEQNELFKKYNSNWHSFLEEIKKSFNIKASTQKDFENLDKFFTSKK